MHHHGDGGGDTVDRVVGLQIGPDDYIPMPFDPRGVLARIKSVLRRAQGAAVPTAGSGMRMCRRVLDLEKRVLVRGIGYMFVPPRIDAAR